MLTREQRTHLDALMRKRHGNAALACRAWCVLLWSAGERRVDTKADDVIGLYLNPPAHAVAFCVVEKAAIQALDRKDRMLPLSPGRAESHGFEYKRNGTLSLFAALNPRTGDKSAARHTSAVRGISRRHRRQSIPPPRNPRHLRQRQQP
jgi:hypothetical protein